jgi:osmotically inducible protein OsmC
MIFRSWIDPQARRGHCALSKAGLYSRRFDAVRATFSGEQDMATAKAHAKWTGTLKEGAGSMSGDSGHLNAPFTFATRFEGAAGGTNPEELIGAAQAGCFSMFLAAQLTNAGHPPTSIETSATVHLGAGPTITRIELQTVAVVPGVNQQVFEEKVEFSKKNCPVSKALASVPEVTFSAMLK